MQYQQENNYPKALIASSAMMGIFLLICYFIVIGMPFKQEDVGTGGIIVNYGTADSGMGEDYMSTEEPSVDPNANKALPDKVVSTDPVKTPSAETSDKTVVTQDAEDAPTVVTNKKNTSDNPSTNPTTATSKPVVNANALYTGKKNTGTGQGDGTGNTPGNQGSRDGDNLSTNYDGTGSGNGSLRLPSRQFISRPKIEDSSQLTGIIVVDIKVDKAGNILDARAGKGTTISDLNLRHKCEDVVKRSHLNPTEKGEDIQAGQVVFRFKVN